MQSKEPSLSESIQEPVKKVIEAVPSLEVEEITYEDLIQGAAGALMLFGMAYKLYKGRARLV